MKRFYGKVSTPTEIKEAVLNNYIDELEDENGEVSVIGHLWQPSDWSYEGCSLSPFVTNDKQTGLPGNGPENTIQLFSENQDISRKLDAYKWNTVEVRGTPVDNRYANYRRHQVFLEVKKIGPASISGPTWLREKTVFEKLKELYELNPLQKPRKQDLKEHLAQEIKTTRRKLRILLVAPKKDGYYDIEEGFYTPMLNNMIHLEEYFVLELWRHNLTTTGDSNMFYNNFVQELMSLSSGYDLICIARGGGFENELETLNNELLCETVIKSPVPICIATGHRRTHLWIKEFADYNAHTPTGFVIFLTDIAALVRGFTLTSNCPRLN